MFSLVKKSDMANRGDLAAAAASAASAVLFRVKKKIPPKISRQRLSQRENLCP
jgi:hypothetical protein